MNKDIEFAKTYEGWTYLDQPVLLFEESIDWKHPILLELHKHVPETARQVKFCAFSATGLNNQDSGFSIMIETVGDPKFRHWHYGHSYSQSSWSYSTQNFVAPLSESKTFKMVLDSPRKGNSRFRVRLVGYQ